METHTKRIHGVWAPIEIWEAKDITPLEKLLFIEIYNLDNEDGCTASNDYLGDFLDCNPNTVSRLIQHLISLNYISVVNPDGKFRRLQSKYKFMRAKEEQINNTQAHDSEQSYQKKTYVKKDSSMAYNIMIAELSLNDTIKDLLRKYVKTVKYKFNVEQYKARIEQLITECNNDEQLIETVVNNSYIHAWKDFYLPTTTTASVQTTNIQRQFINVYNHPDITKTHHLKLSVDEFNSLLMDKKYWPKNAKYGTIDYSDLSTNQEHFDIVSNSIRLMLGEVDMYLDDLINKGFKPNCEGLSNVYKWLGEHKDWPKYYEKGFDWWMCNKN